MSPRLSQPASMDRENVPPPQNATLANAPISNLTSDSSARSSTAAALLSLAVQNPPLTQKEKKALERAQKKAVSNMKKQRLIDDA